MATARAKKPVEPAMVAGVGRDKAGRTVYAVLSASEPTRWHLVVNNRGRLQCDCTAAHYGRRCRHVAAAEDRRDRDEAEREYWRQYAHEQNAACCGY